MEVNRNIAYIRDAEGVTMAVGETSLKDEVVHHYPQFKMIKNTLTGLENDIHREDDVWLFSYPKSGKFILRRINMHILILDIRGIT